MKTTRDIFHVVILAAACGCPLLPAGDEGIRPFPHPSMEPFPAPQHQAPIGYALFPKEINVPPKAWVERSTGASMIHWTEMPRGGHFAALEQPELLAADVRRFFSEVRALQDKKR